MEFGPIKCTYGNFPELNKYRDKIFVIYAGAHPDYTMVKRNNEDVLAEIDQAIKDGYTKIIFHNAAETYQPRVARKAQLIVELSNHYEDNMFFMQTASHDAQASYDKCFKEWGATRKIHMLPCDHFEFIMHEFANQLYTQIIPEYKVKLKEKKFVCFNKVDRIHRVQLFAKVLETPGLLEKSFYSFEGTSPEWYTIHTEARWGKKIADTLKKNEHIFPLRLNITENRHNPIDLIPEDLYYHDESYFSVVTETIYYKEGEEDKGQSLLNYDDGVFFSEKIFKPITLKHPFILVGFPGSLKKLRERGYKTFAPFIDESYDEIDNGRERLDAIFKEIVRLCELTDEQWMEWQNNVKSIVEYNFEVFQNKKTFGLAPVEHLFAN